MRVIRVLLVFGTRPEAIKMAPVLKQLRKEIGIFDVRVCVTAQHRQMLDQVLQIFEIIPDYDLNVMQTSQDLADITSAVLVGLKPIFRDWCPNIVLVHGDTTTTLATAMAAFYERIPVGHVEAGLRTGNLSAPWPEEFNRRVAGIISNLHFAPTFSAKQNLLSEGIHDENIIVTGNTVIDALMATVKHIESKPNLESQLRSRFPHLTGEKKIILVTGHRRENFGQGFDSIFAALREILRQNSDAHVIYPVHLNPKVRVPAERELAHEIESERVSLVEPQDYLAFVFLMKNADLIITDSGGVQEEAPTFGVPVLVTREVTERPEALETGIVKLVGTAIEKIVCEASLFLNTRKLKDLKNPYGDGEASVRISKELIKHFRKG
jgi:UDP-N-acetylglucosamine 2-epimerase (non-hydrolysing)